MRVLIAHGANVNAVNTFGNTPLHEAASGDNPSIVQMLLEAGELSHRFSAHVMLTRGQLFPRTSAAPSR